MNEQELAAKLNEMPDAGLLILRTVLRTEIRKRGIADSVGAIGERLTLEHFRRTAELPNLQASPRGTKNVDALSRNGDRFSIKTVCEGSKTGTIYPDAEDRKKQLFEYMLVVKLTPDWSLESIHQLSWSDFVKVRSWDKRMTAWYVGFNRRALAAAALIHPSARHADG